MVHLGHRSHLLLSLSPSPTSLCAVGPASARARLSSALLVRTGGKRSARGNGVVEAIMGCATRIACHSVRRRAASLPPLQCSSPEQFPSVEPRGGGTVLRPSPWLAVMPRQPRHVGASGGERRRVTSERQEDRGAASPGSTSA